MASTDCHPVPKKNAAFRVPFSIRNAAGVLITSWAGADSEVSLDQGAFADCTNEATEIGTSGFGYIDLTAAEMNTNHTLLQIKVTNTGAVVGELHFYPQTTGDIRVDLNSILGTLLTETVSGYIAAGFKKLFDVLNGTANLLNLPLNTDYTSARATKLDNLDAPVSSRSTFAGGAVASVTADVGITQAGADKVWGSAARTLSSFGTLVADVWAGVTQAFFAKFFNTNSGSTYGGAVPGSVVKEIADNASSDPATIADAVWDEATAGHVTAGTFGVVVAGLVASIFATLAASVTTAGSWAKYVYDTLASILLKTDTIGIGVTFAQMPVGPDGRTQLVKGSTYKTAYGLALEYEFDGYPAFPLVGGSCTWFAPARHSSAPFSKAGTILTTTRVRFELTYAESASLAGNVCSIQVMLAADNPIRTPNMPLDLLDSVGA